MKVDDHDLPEDFDVMLDKCKRYLKGDWESEFVYDLQDKYDEYGDDMFLSSRQYTLLRTIYNRSHNST